MTARPTTPRPSTPRQGAPSDPSTNKATSPGRAGGKERSRSRDRRADVAPLAGLEADRQRSFQDAQREADTMFAQYQLSQLLASGAGVADLGTAVLDELRRHDDTPAAALWLTPPGGGPLTLVAAVLDDPTSGPDGAVPERLEDASAASDWCSRSGWSGVPLEESRDAGGGFEQHSVGFVALAPRGAWDTTEPPSFLPRVRHELAMAFRAAQLREALARDRSLLQAILDGATDAIVAVDAQGAVVRLNRAALALLDLSPEAVPGSCRDLLGCARPRSGVDGRQLRCWPRCPFAEVIHGAPPIVGREQTVMGRHDEESTDPRHLRRPDRPQCAPRTPPAPRHPARRPHIA